MWKSQSDARDSRDLDQFVDWLHRHRHDELANLIHQDADTALSLTAILKNPHEHVLLTLARLDGVLSSIARYLPDFHSLAEVTHLRSHISQQAVSLLRQLNESGATLFMGLAEDGGISYRCWGGDCRKLEIEDPRSIDEDLLHLCQLGLLSLERGLPSRRYSITRAGAALAAYADRDSHDAGERIQSSQFFRAYCKACGSPIRVGRFESKKAYYCKCSEKPPHPHTGLVPRQRHGCQKTDS